ncbi:MAG: glycosyltransferase [Paludibacteraceae bacterium]|nr:glycosyltransferase [Paludibacteraceae bacterium]
MKLSIITINFNNAAGLKKTLDSVAAQDLLSIPTLHSNLSTLISPLTIEHIIVDGGSTDGSIDVIKDYESNIAHRQLSILLKWVSEKDKGIYNAMNKGIEIAMGRRVVDSFNRSELIEDSNLSSLNSNLSPDHYLQILNSGDLLASNDVCAKMSAAMSEKNYPDILYGNMIKFWPDGHQLKDSCKGPQKLTMLSFYHGTLNHDSAYIRLSLFDKFGLYDENLKIVSDWEWYLKAIPLGGVVPVYAPIDVTLFDMTGVSESNTAFWKVERRPVLEREVPAMILADYDRYARDMHMMDRIRRHHLYPLVYFMERVLFKLEKWHILK